MKNWNKKQISKETVKALCDTYGMEPLVASIMARRGITSGNDIQFFLETDKRFLHNPFEFTAMSDAVDRILQAQDEGEKVLIFGDRDVDGVTSTTVLYDALTALGIDTTWRLPSGNDAYGLNKAAIDDFAAAYGTLIITVDCGISNNKEIAYASSLGMDVLVLDHHTAPETLPSPAIIIDPKCADSGYPFADISGCAVAFKVAQALRFSKSELYKQEICLLSVRQEENRTDGACTIDCLKLENLVKTASLSETIVPGTKSITDTGLIPFLTGQQIFVWDGPRTEQLLSNLFGRGVEFNLLDIRPEVAKLIPAVLGMSLSRVKTLSKIARYNLDEATEIDGFYNIFVTFMEKQLLAQFPQHAEAEKRDLQLVALAALADIMPLVDENRIFLFHGIAAMNETTARPGLLELLSCQGLLSRRITSSDLSWNIVPVLNAAGRLGKPELAVELFLEKDVQKRDELARGILALNQQRKQLGSDAWGYAQEQAEKSLSEYGGNLCVVIDERINRGVSGIVASRLVQHYGVPSMAVTSVGELAIGSIRSCRGFDITVFLDSLGDIFENHGGHRFAGGFSLNKSRIDEFKALLKERAAAIILEDDSSERIDIDAELPVPYLSRVSEKTAKPEILSTVDRFEPYGEGNRELIFMTRRIKIQDAQIMGKTERQHLKLTFDCGAVKWPAMFWGEAERLHRDFDKGDTVDIVYTLGRNTFNGMETPQMILKDVRLTQ
ncbi:MAG: single-stranded-DNA-specific exonuclease RecJ [Treponema sp.]|nr:single-stranded-DNA-specific exonuclease RecJ [Treponema sp.]